MQSLMSKYNNRKHRTIHMTSSSVKGSNIEKHLLQTAYNITKKFQPGQFAKFKVLQNVMIYKYKSLFDKGYTPSWSTEISIYKIQNTIPITYLLKDINNVKISGCFYEQELQKVKYPNCYLVEKILKRKGDKVLVKWLGFNNVHNSWEKKKNIL